MSTPNGDSCESQHARKRVGKACDRCRLKKSKCDGTSPCSRCRIDNAICVFGERKKSQDRVYPKGYVEMIEAQQVSITKGLRQMYRTLVDNNLWSGSTPNEQDGVPLTHDILTGLGVLQTKQFEDDFDAAQERMLKENGPSARSRRIASGSESSDDESVEPKSTMRKPKPELRVRMESACSSPASRTSSFSSASSHKRSPETPSFDQSPPPISKKPRTTTSFHPTIEPYSAPQSPDSFDYSNYSMASPAEMSPWAYPNPEPFMQTVPLNMTVLSSGLQSQSPVFQSISPGYQSISPGFQSMSPGFQSLSSGLPSLSPGIQQQSYVDSTFLPSMSNELDILNSWA